MFEHLDRYIIADDVTLTDETETTATFSVEGPQAERALQDASHAGRSFAPRATMAHGPVERARLIAQCQSPRELAGYFSLYRPPLKTELAAKLSDTPAGADADGARGAHRKRTAALWRRNHSTPSGAGNRDSCAACIRLRAVISARNCRACPQPGADCIVSCGGWNWISKELLPRGQTATSTTAPAWCTHGSSGRNRQQRLFPIA